MFEVTPDLVIQKFVIIQLYNKRTVQRALFGEAYTGRS